MSDYHEYKSGTTEGCLDECEERLDQCRAELEAAREEERYETARLRAALEAALYLAESESLMGIVAILKPALEASDD